MHREVRLVFQLLRLNFEPDLECEKNRKKQERGEIILMLHSLLVIRIQTQSIPAGGVNDILPTSDTLSSLSCDVGIIWPVECIPYPLRYLSLVLPQTYASEALRCIMYRGNAHGQNTSHTTTV